MPGILSGEDLIVGAETGSGKTLAYLLPIVERLLRGHAVAKDLPDELLGEQTITSVLWRDTSMDVCLLCVHSPGRGSSEALTPVGRGKLRHAGLVGLRCMKKLP